MINTPPLGYIDTGIALVHVSRVRDHTRDVHRFLEYLPLARQLIDAEPDSQEAVDIFTTAASVPLLLETARELSSLFFTLSVDMDGTP